MFGFVSKKKLLEILRELAKNNDGIGEAYGQQHNFYYYCGVANAINYVCHKLKLDYHA